MKMNISKPWRASCIRCVVPQCSNTKITAPEKAFFSLPCYKQRRDEWLLAMKSNKKSLSPKTVFYVCEDHFDAENDVNYHAECQLLPTTRPVLKRSAMPTKFACQVRNLPSPGRSKSTRNKQRKDVVENILGVACMATLCRTCGDDAEAGVSLLDTSQHHLQWAINHFHIELDDALPTSVCQRCDNIILEWTLFLARKEKARSLFSTLMANQAQLGINSSVPGTERLQEPHLSTSRPHTSNASVPSTSSASVPHLSLPQHLVTKYHIKDFTIRLSRLSDQVLGHLQQNDTVDCNFVNNSVSEQRKVSIKLEPAVDQFVCNDQVLDPLQQNDPVACNIVDNQTSKLTKELIIPETVDQCVCIDQVSGNLQQHLNNTEVDDFVVPFEAIYDPLVKCEPDLVQSEPRSHFSAVQSEIHHFPTFSVNQEEIEQVEPDFPELETSPEASNICTLVFKCVHCNFTTDHKKEMTSHIANIHGQRPRYQCQECHRSFIYKKSLNKHIRSFYFHNFTCKCMPCKRGFKLQTHLKRHSRNVCGNTKSSSLPCDMCNKMFYTEAGLNKHAREVHSNVTYTSVTFVSNILK